MTATCLNALFAGLSPLKEDSQDYCLVLVARKWFRWHIKAIYHGQLAYLRIHCQHLPIAIAILDTLVIHWTEEFPPHLSLEAIHAYLKLAKPELLANPANTLTLEKINVDSTHSLSIRCWLLTELTRHELCQTWQNNGLSISALEPLSYLDARPTEAYEDQQHLLATIDPSHQTAVFRALKLACRRNWAAG